MQSKKATQPEIVWGAEGIAEVIQQPLRQTFYLLEKGLLPARKVGRRWQSTRSALLASLNPQAGANGGKAA